MNISLFSWAESSSACHPVSLGIDTSALLRLDHPSEVPSSWCPLFLLPGNPEEEDTVSRWKHRDAVRVTDGG